MFLIRSAFWLALLVMLVPSDPKEQARMYQTASQALHHAATFCDRNPQLCREAEGHWEVFKGKLAVGARMVADLVNERLTGGTPQPALRPAPMPTIPALDTLAPQDRLPPWRTGQRSQL
jgi:hypothetical protein